jgi:uncharacterized membrane protein YqgA involved in biofilm formation
MFRGVGTVLNISTILVGSTIGVVAGGRIRDKTRELITDILGFVTLLGAANALIPLFTKSFNSALPKGWAYLTILICMLLGGVVGSALELEERVEHFGAFLRDRFKSNQGTFVEGFLSASLLFAIGPLAILGSISDGMGTGIDQLVLKSLLDLFASMAFASTLGWGVAASAIPVGIYQTFWTLLGLILGNVLSDYQVAAMTICGGLMLVGISLRLLRIREIAVGNLLPALAFAPVVTALLHHYV